MDNSILYIEDKQEYAEFLKFKKEKILREAEAEALRIEEKITKLFSEDLKNGNISGPGTQQGNGTAIEKKDNVGKRGSVGWKYIVDDILRQTGLYLNANEITAAAIQRPDLTVTPEVAKKSIGSTLITNSTSPKNRYLSKKVNGYKAYTLNKDYKE